jgi:hypothetical protein
MLSCIFSLMNETDTAANMGAGADLGFSLMVLVAEFGKSLRNLYRYETGQRL